MDITFKTKKLEKIFNSEKELKKLYGAKRARKIMIRMKILASANSLEDVPISPPTRCHQLKKDRDEQFAVVIIDNWRLLFIVNQVPLPRREDGGIEKSLVTNIKILKVEDYHGK